MAMKKVYRQDCYSVTHNCYASFNYEIKISIGKKNVCKGRVPLRSKTIINNNTVKEINTSKLCRLLYSIKS